MRNILFFILSIWLVITSQGFAQLTEVHEFGTLNTQWYIYSDGRTWKFLAQNSMIVKYVEVKSVLASATRGTFHIELRIKDSLIGKWDQYVLTTTYLPYYHTNKVTYPLIKNDTIYYKIYGNLFWTPEGGLLGINYVKLSDTELTDVKLDDTTPTKFLLSQNYPNPFNPITRIKYSLPINEFITLKIYDTLGKEIITLVSEEKQAGSYEVNFDGSYLPSGIYFYKIQAGEFIQTKKMILMK